jgi:hypothetical protein
MLNASGDQPMTQRTPAQEQARYEAVHAQIADQVLAAIEDRSPATSILRAMLVSEMIVRNEQAHNRYQARLELIQVIERRIAILEAQDFGRAMYALVRSAGTTEHELSEIIQGILNLAKLEDEEE